MKRYKLLRQDGWSTFVEGLIYKGDDRGEFFTVEFLATQGSFKDDWEEVVEVVETDEEVVNKLVREYWFSHENANHLVKEYNKIQTITIYEVAKLIESFK